MILLVRAATVVLGNLSEVLTRQFTTSRETEVQKRGVSNGRKTHAAPARAAHTHSSRSGINTEPRMCVTLLEMLYFCVKQEAAPLEYVALVLSRLAQHNGIPGSLEYVGLILGRPAWNTSRTMMRVPYPLSNSKMRCSLLFRERGVVAGERPARGRVTGKNTPKTLITGTRSLARTASQSVLMRNTATAW
jgi:hypothetical protein